MKRKTDIVFLIISIVIGIVLGVLEETFYQAGIRFLDSRILTVTIYLFIYALILGIILLFKGLRNGTFVNFGKVMLFTVLAMVAFVGFTALFEFLYELGGNKISQKQASELQYVFLIDDSGSMTSNDEDNLRYDAVEEIIGDMVPTNRFAVYSFSDETFCVTPMESKQSLDYTYEGSEELMGGGTYMLTAIDDAMKDVCNSKNVHTKIIVLTDGVPSDSGLGSEQKLIRNCLKKGASVSSVGFGDADEEFLKELAAGTGGTYVFSDNLENLTDNLDTIVKAQTLPLDANRDLIGYRLDLTYDNFWYGFMRVGFLILLGALWTVIKMLLVGERKFTKSAMVISLVLCSLAAVLCELFMLVGFGGGLVRVLFCGLWACTIIPKNIYMKVDLDNSLHTKKNDGNERSLFDDLNSRSQEVGGPKSFL